MTGPTSHSDFARRCFALAEFMKEGDFGDRVRVVPFKNDDSLEMQAEGFWFDFGEREPDSSLIISRAGDVIEHRCSYSGHNGDSYDHKFLRLEYQPALKALQGLHAQLERRALAAEERRLEQAALRRRTEAAKKNLNARLKQKGLL